MTNYEENYLRAKKLGDRQVSKARAAGEYPYLPALDDRVEKKDIAGEFYVGQMEVPLDLVIGTKTSDRQNAFSRGFMPILELECEFGQKWTNLSRIQEEEGIRDAVKVYEYFQKFYVQEGNKRVSVMKFNDMPLILANITRVMPRRTEEKDNKIYYEFCEFFQAAPIYGIIFSEEGGYEKLAEVIGRDLKEPWPEEVVQTVRSAFRRFESIFKAKGGEHLSITAGDAFYIFLTVYSVDRLVNETNAQVEKRMALLWNEYLVQSRESNNRIALVENPEAIDSAGASRAIGSVFAFKKPNYTDKNPLRVSFIYDKTPQESGWINAHEMGRTYIEERFGGIVKTEKHVSCAVDEDIRKAVEESVENGAQLIITTSPAQMPETLRCAVRRPNIRFMNCSINLSHNAVRTYYGKMYEAKFLMGVLAAQMAKNHKIGFLADYPIYGTCANINAFAIGASMVDPDAEIYLKWKSTKNTNWKQEMLDAGVSVFSGPDSIMPQEMSREYGIYRIDEAGNIVNLATPVWNWGKYYELIVGTILRDTWNARDIAKKDRAINFWWGMKSGVIDIAVSKKVPYNARKLIEIFRQGLINQQIVPFSGELHSQKGLVRGADGTPLSNEEIITMDWLNDNIIGSMPTMDELQESARETVQISGVELE